MSSAHLLGLPTYFDALTAAGKACPPLVHVKQSQYNAWLKTEGVAHYRGVQLVPRAEQRPRRKADTANWIQQLEVGAHD